MFDMLLAVKRDNEIQVGLSVRDSLVDMTERDVSLLENIPFWKVKGVKDCYVFAEDLTYAVDLLKHSDYVFKNLTDAQSIIDSIIPKMKDLLAKHLRLLNGKEWDSQLLIVKDGKMYSIDHFFTVMEESQFVAFNYVGYLLGGLEEFDENSPIDAILFATRKLKEIKNVNMFPLVTFNTKTKKVKTYYN